MRNNFNRLVILGALLLRIFWSTEASAQDPAREAIPPELEPWVPWVLAESGEQACASIGEVHTCVWPGQLTLKLTASGGRFEQKVSAGARADHTLPGAHGAWPENVTVDGQEVFVLERDGKPTVELTPGEHDIQGRFSWSRVPEMLHVGRNSAFISLTVFDKYVPLVKREDGNIWLKGLSADSEQKDVKEQVELQVFRQLRDGIPLLVETKLIFQVSGKARELSFLDPLIVGTIPLNVEGDLAVALEQSGALRVQLVPGRHELTVLARSSGMPALIQNHRRAEPWPHQEVWTWHPDTALRSVEISGAPGIDASRTNLPEGWRADSAYALEQEDALKLITTRRGQEQVPSNHIQLRREFWLDEAANYFTVRDTLTGQMHQDWRLNLISGELGQVQVGGESQVITMSNGGSTRGVEVRDSELSLVAVSRLKKTNNLKAVGWSEDVDSLSTIVHLPPGFQLLAATGVDDASDTWLSRWDLFSVFYVFLLSLAIARLVSPLAGGIAGVALTLAHGESDSPEYIWLPLIVFSALIVLFEQRGVQRWLRACFYVTALALLIVFSTFAVSQVRAALYPHLDVTFADPSDFKGLVEEAVAPLAAPESAEAVAAAPPQVFDQAKKQEGGLGTRGGSFAGSLGARQKSASSYDYQSQKQFKPDAIVQTGPGIPNSSGRSWQLNWSGPVARDHTMQIYLISPNMQRFLTGLRLILLAGLGLIIWRRVHAPLSSPPKSKKNLSGIAAAAFLLTICAMPQLARADEPSDARLAELKQRLLKQPSCQPNCVSVSSLDVQLADELFIRATVHAGAKTAYKLPGPATALADVRLLVNKKEAAAVRLESDGAYYLQLFPGVYEVELRARLVSERITLDLGTAPERVHISPTGWTVSGVNDLGRVEGGTLTLQREVDTSKTPEGGASAAKSEVAVPPFFLVRRAISLAVTGQVVTQIERISDETIPEVLLLPLLAGERLTTPGIEVRDGRAIIPFPRELRAMTLNSTLALPEDGTQFALRLAMPERSTTTETWEIQCGVVWHCVTDGITATANITQGHVLSVFHPWPGEALQLSAIQPPAAPGSSITVQNATLTLNPGIRLSQGHLQMSVLTTAASVHTVSIPPHAKLDAVEVDGVGQAVKAQDGKVRISLSPGLRQISVRFQESSGLSLLFRSPQVSTGAEGVNYGTVLDLPEKRWLLWAGGPAQGPAILLWGYLVLIMAAAFLLPRLPFAPLAAWQWILLGLGLTQVPAVVALLVAGWFFAVGSRHKWPKMKRLRHNFLQVGLIGYTVLFLVVLTIAVYQGLVSSPDMEVRGAGSYNSHLVWVSDRSLGAFAPVWSLSLSIWVWRIFMLAWALWLSRSLLTWLKWAWEKVSADQFWAPAEPKVVPPKVSVDLSKTQGGGELQATTLSNEVAPLEEPEQDK